MDTLALMVIDRLAYRHRPMTGMLRR